MHVSVKWRRYFIYPARYHYNIIDIRPTNILVVKRGRKGFLGLKKVVDLMPYLIYNEWRPTVQTYFRPSKYNLRESVFVKPSTRALWQIKKDITIE